MIKDSMDHMVDFITDMRLPEVHVTANVLEAANHLQQGRPVVLVNPPAVTPIAGQVYQMQFNIIVAAGPFDKPDRATETLAPLVTELLTSALMPEQATPQTFESFEGRNYPCYVLTCTTDSDEENSHAD